MSALYRNGIAEVHGNLTPMIDMVFLLIVFFVLVSRIVDVQRVEMNLPQPRDAAAQKQSDERRVVINVMPGAGGRAEGYRIANAEFPPGQPGLAAMTDHVARLYQTNPLMNINIRADRSTQYEYVEPVLRAVSAAARRASISGDAARVNLVVLQED